MVVTSLWITTTFLKLFYIHTASKITTALTKTTTSIMEQMCASMTFQFLLHSKDLVLSFTQEGISHEKTHNCDTCESHIARNSDQDKRIFLKMDVEGAEWLTFLNMPEKTLLQCNQIAVEVHDLSGLGINTMCPKASLEEKVAVMKKITKHFHCWNVHANNYASMFIVDGYKVPDVMEMTFVNKKLHPGGKIATELFPTKYDQACHAYMQDHILDFWPFYSPQEIIAPKKPFIEQKFAHLKRSLSTRKWKYLRKRHAK